MEQSEIEAAIDNMKSEKVPEPDEFSLEWHKSLKDLLMSFLLKAGQEDSKANK